MTWANDILSKFGAPQTQNNLQKLAAWNACEGNLNGQSGLGINNPFNTTLSCCGALRSVNSAGVKYYPSISAGVDATVQTLQSPRYSLVVANLRGDGSASTFATAVGSSGWGTSGSCIAKQMGTAVAANPTPTGVQFNYAQLEAIWIQAGGNQQYAPMAAAIAMAESGGNANANNTNSNGSIDRGLWQINSSNGTGSTFDVMTNARTAVKMSNSGTNWRPWCTAYSDGACGSRGGTYLGPGSPYQRFYQVGIAPDFTAPINATNAAANVQLLSTSSSGQHLNQWDCLFGTAPASDCDPVSRVIKLVLGTVLTPVVQVVAGALGVAAGVIMMIVGFYLVLTNTRTGRQAAQGTGQAVRLGAQVVAPESRLAGARVATYEREMPSGQTRVTTVTGQRRFGRYRQRSTTSMYGTPTAQRPPAAATRMPPQRGYNTGGRPQGPAPDTRTLLRGEAGSYRR